jgi:hypothetical protein
VTSIETRQLPRTKPQPRTEERNKNLLKKRPKSVKKTLKDRSSVTRTSKKGSHKQLDSKRNVEQNKSNGAAAAMAQESAPNLKVKESERERRETTPRAEGQRA